LTEVNHSYQPSCGKQHATDLTIKCHPLQEEVNANSLVVRFPKVILGKPWSNRSLPNHIKGGL